MFRPSALRSSGSQENGEGGGGGGGGGGSSSKVGDVSMSAIEQMMQRLLNASEGKQKVSFNESIQNAIAEHVQPLKEEIKAERTERLHQHSETQIQLEELRSQMGLLQRGGNSGGMGGESSTDDIVIGGFRGKTKAGAIIMVKRLIAEAPGSPTIVEDRIGNAPDVVPIKFSTVEAARQFVDNNKAIKHFRSEEHTLNSSHSQ